VSPDQAERLALASTEGKIQLALRNPMDQGSPVTQGIKPAGLLGTTSTVAQRSAGSRPATGRPKAAPVAEQLPPAPPPAPTVEMIRGDKRATEIIK
jgi:pilus assembly protein CpaB